MLDETVYHHVVREEDACPVAKCFCLNLDPLTAAVVQNSTCVGLGDVLTNEADGFGNVHSDLEELHRLFRDEDDSCY